MTNKEYNQLKEGLLRQRQEIGNSKKKAKKLLVDLGIFHLLVPKGTNEKRTKEKEAIISDIQQLLQSADSETLKNIHATLKGKSVGQ